MTTVTDNESLFVNAADPKPAKAAPEDLANRIPIFEVRPEEQEYARLPDVVPQEVNRYGLPIDLVATDSNDFVAERSMEINGNHGVGEYPHRNKQHGFHFTADNCIGCHACEAACSEKNDNPAHIAFRSVGYVEGGSYPSYQRMNISMACNHCDDPVCLKGCPTRAYTKYPEYGAVLQDPNTCFGCGYCTWVCPYNAPQLDPIQGQVSKCNMCVDRLEEGLKPACVSACLGNALNFGVIEETPEQREQIKTQIPGFPDPSITQPNIRFQQTRTLPEEMTRTDSAPVKYHLDEKEGRYIPVVDQKKGKAIHWNFSRLSSRENPLVMFTLLSQTAIGAFFLSFFGQLAGVELLQQFRASDAYVFFMGAVVGMVALGLLMSTVHLGKPMRFYRGFNNLKHSPVSREGLGITLFLAFAGLHTMVVLPENSIFQSIWTWMFSSPLSANVGNLANSLGLLAALGATGGLYYMYKSYRIKARPFWNHWQTATSFVGNAVSLGSVLTAATFAILSAILGNSITESMTLFGAFTLAGLALESLGLYLHAKYLNQANNEGSASHYVQLTTFGKTYYLRNALLLVNLILASILVFAPLNEIAAWAVLGLLLMGVTVTAVIGRALFYVLVIPTTMPGAFFWKNKGFEQHAKDVGLAEMPQVGVVPDAH